ncbi:hypothetical protein [Rhizobium laguerreae]|uniref:hypothetical protein n=1 Tax=Rhizobium laguerreae TaxID=1076926 RepID=UPI001C90E93D|nr:hypothetical protein [Rhizobium laguerreae]MBY3201339.1 hypothetical protein [Rhizobium laguerreae]
MAGYVFYALEITGSDVKVDKIVRVTAVNTDHEFKIRDHFDESSTTERDAGLTETAGPDGRQSRYDMMSKLVAKFREWSPAIFLGFNTIVVGERFLRQAFYETLYDPFLTTSGSNGRSDVLRMVQGTTIHAPGAIALKRDSEKKYDMSLEGLLRANGLPPELPPVEACIALCRLMNDTAPEVVSTCSRFSYGASVPAFLEEEPVVVLGSSKFDKISVLAVVNVGIEPSRPSVSIAFDLAINPDDLLHLSDDALAVKLATSPSPLKRIRHSSCPILTSFDELFPVGGVAPQELLRRASVLINDEAFRRRLLFATPPQSLAPQLENGVERERVPRMASDTDRELMARFHDVAPAERRAVLDKLQDEELRRMGGVLLSGTA